MKITVGELKRFLNDFDSDSEVHFLLNHERIYPFERYATDLGPMFSFQTTETKPRPGITSYDWIQDAIITDSDDVA